MFNTDTDPENKHFRCEHRKIWKSKFFSY
jgi:hypothetical protein